MESRLFNISTSVAYYATLVVLAVFSNSTGSARFGVLCFFGAGLLGGITLFNQKQLKLWLLYLPLVAVLITGTIINPQLTWPLEFIGLSIGFYLTSKYEFSNLNRFVLTGLMASFTILATYQVAYYDFDENTTSLSNTRLSFSPNDTGRFKIIQFSTKYCGQCEPQTEFLSQYLATSGKCYPLQCVYMTSSFSLNDSIDGFKKNSPLIALGGNYTYDAEGEVCKKFNIEAFPALVIIDMQKQKHYTILGFAGDMRYAYSKKLTAILEGKYEQ